MSLGGGISTQANITVSLNLQKSKAWTQMKTDVTSLKAALNDLAQTVGIEKPLSSYAKLQKELDKTKAALSAIATKAQQTGRAETEAATESARAQVVLVSKLNKTKAGLEQLGQMGQEATKGLVSGWMKMTNQGTLATDGLQKMKQAAQGVTYSFDKDGKVVGAFASEIDQADKEARGLAQAMDLATSSTKQMLPVDKALADAEEAQATAMMSAAKAARATDFSRLDQELRNNIASSKKARQESSDLKRSWDAEFAAAKVAASYTRTKEKADNAAAIAAKKLSDAATRVRDRLKEEAAALDKVKASMSTFVGKISALEREMDAVFRASFRLKMAGMDLTMLAQRMQGFMAGVMKTFGDFQYTMNRAAGALAVSDENMGQFQSTILDAAGTLKMFPIGDVAEAMYYFGSTTGDVISGVEDMKREFAALTPIMQAAAMTNTSYEDTIKGVYSILAQYYNGAVGMAKEVTEQLFYVTQKTAAEFGDLISSFKMVGPIAKANNVTFGQMVDLFGQLADLGVRGSMAGRAFRQIFIQMLRPSGPAVKALTEVFNLASATVKEFSGKSYFELMFPKGQFVGIQGYLKNLALATEHMTQAERNSFLAKIATANELPVLTALVNKNIRALHGQADAQDKQLSSAQEASKYFQENWKRLSQSWNATTNQVNVAIDSLKVTVGSVMAPILSKFLEQLQGILVALRKWAEDSANKEIIGFLTKVVAIGTGLIGVSGAVLTLTGSLLGLGAAGFIMVRTFGSFFLKIGAAITGVITLGDALIRNFDELQADVQYALKTINDSFEATGMSVQSITDTISGYTEVLRGIMDVIVKAGGTVTRIFAEIVAYLNRLGVLGPALQVVSAALLTMFSMRVVTAMLSISRLLPSIGARLLFTAGGMKTISSAFSTARLGGAVLGLGKVGTAVMGIKAAVRSLATAIGPLGIAGLILGVGIAAYETDFAGFKEFIDGLTTRFRDLRGEIDKTKKEFGQAGDEVEKVAREIAKSNLFQEPELGNTIMSHKFKTNNDIWSTANGVFSFFGPKGEIKTTFGSYNDALREMTRETDLEVSKMMGDWKGLADITGRSISDISTAVTQASKVITDPNATNEFVQKLFDAIPSGSDSGAIAAGYDKLKEYYGPVLSSSKEDFVKWFMSEFSDMKTAAQKAIDFRQAEADAFYGPIFKQIDNAISQGASDKIITDMLINPINRNINGELIAGLSISDVAGKLSPDLQSAFSTFLQYLGRSSADDLTSEIDSASSIFEQQWKGVADQITAALADSMVTDVYTPAMAEIGPEIAKILNNLPNIGVKGGETPILDNLQIIMQKYEDEALQLPDYIKSALFQVGDLLHNKGVLTEGDYTRLTKDFQETGTAIAETVNKSFSELVDAFTAGVDLHADFKKTVQEAMKRGTDIKQLRQMVLDLSSKWLKKARGGNLQMKQLAQNLMDTDMTAIASGFAAYHGTKAKTAYVAALIRQFNIHRRDMPKNVRAGVSGVIDTLVNSGQVNLNNKTISKWKNKIAKDAAGVIPTKQDILSYMPSTNVPGGGMVATGLTAAMDAAIASATGAFNNPQDKTTGTAAPTSVAAPVAPKFTTDQSVINTQLQSSISSSVQTASQSLAAVSVPVSINPLVEIASTFSPSVIGDAITQAIGDVAIFTLITMNPLIIISDSFDPDLIGTAIVTAIGTQTIDVPVTMNVNIGDVLTDITSKDWKGTGNTAGSDLAAGFNTGFGTFNVPVGVAILQDQILNTDWTTIANTAGTNIASGFNTGYGGSITLPGDIAHILSQITGTAWNFSGNTAGMNIATGFNAGYNQNITLPGSIGGLFAQIQNTDWSGAGNKAGSSVAVGINSGYSANINVIGRAKATLGSLVSLGWNFGGQRAGSAWASGLNTGIRNNIDKTLTFTASVLIGGSPPKAGPLRHIDKGGYNIGKSWGMNMALGAEREVDKGIRRVGHKVQRDDFGGAISVNHTVEKKRKVDINITIKSDGTKVDKDTTSQIRRSVYDALVDNDLLEHFVTVG